MYATTVLRAGVLLTSYLCVAKYRVRDLKFATTRCYGLSKHSVRLLQKQIRYHFLEVPGRAK